MSLEPGNPRDIIAQYTPGGTLDFSTHGYRRVVIQLFGFLGHGKSSLINSCVCVVKDEGYENVADAGTNQGGRTTQRQQHELTETLLINDNRGFAKLNDREILEACAQIRSLRDMGEVEWEKDNLEETLKQFPLKNQNRPADFILPVLVYRAATMLSPGDAECLQKLIIKIFKVTGIHPIVVITQCTAENFNAIKVKFGELGVTRRLSVENYTENHNERTEEKDRRILEFLHECIKEAERGIKKKENHNTQIRFVNQAVEQIRLETALLREELTKPPPEAPKKEGCRIS